MSCDACSPRSGLRRSVGQRAHELLRDRNMGSSSAVTALETKIQTAPRRFLTRSRSDNRRIAKLRYFLKSVLLNCITDGANGIKVCSIGRSLT
jgi:hypothetical protein